MRMSVEQSRPVAQLSRFTVGRDRDGNWIVCDRLGLVGGLFADREAAVHFALVESGRVPGAVCCSPDDEFMRLGSVFEPAEEAPRPARHH